MLFYELMSRPSDKKLKKIVKKWWNIYESNKKIGLNHLIIILLRFAGITYENSDLDTLADDLLKSNILSNDHDLNCVPICLQKYSNTLNKFMDILLQRKFWAVIQDLSFICPLMSVIELMRESPQDSVRAVSYLSGMKLLRQSHYLSDYLITAHIPNKIALVRRIEELKSKVHLNLRYSLRDNAAYLRTIPLKELLSWAEDNPYAMIEENIRIYIKRGLKDSFIGNRKLTLNIICIIFEKPSFINREQQQKFFNSLMPELTLSLRSNEELDFLILKIVNQASKFLDVIITSEEDLNVSMCLYSENGSVLTEAKAYFYRNHLQGKTGVYIISETFKFYKGCPVKNAPKLVEILMPYYVGHTTWLDWEICLKSCLDNDVNDFLNIFYLYVSSVNRPSLNNLDSSMVTNMKDEFSIYFSKCWQQLMETDKIIMNSKAQVFMLKLATSFNVQKILKKTQAAIIDWCFNNFHQSRNHEVIKECLLCLHFINSFNKNIEIEKILISQALTEFDELLNDENKETEVLYLSYYKVHLLVRIYDKYNHGNLWTSLTSLLEKCRDLEKVQYIISLLYHLFINKVKKYIHFKNHSDICNEDLLSTEEKGFQYFLLKSEVTSSSIIVIQAASNFIRNISHHMNDNANLAKNMMVPLLFGDLIRLSKNQSFSEFLDLSCANIESYVVYCSKIMNTDCQRKGHSALDNCCVLLNDYVLLTMEGKICISYFKFFIMNFDKVNSHWLIMIKLFHFLINIKNNPIGAYALINGLISFHNASIKKLLDEETIKVKLSEITTFIFDSIDDKEGKDFQRTILHLYLYSEKLVALDCNIYRVLMENFKSYLSEEIRMMLVSKNASIHY